MLLQNPPVEIAHRFWMLGTTEYPLFLLRDGEDGVIFEGGTGAMGPVLAEQFQRLEIGPGAVKQIVITHAHPDHVMAVPMLRELFPQVTVLASAKAAQTLSAEKAIGFFCQIDNTLTESLLAAGSISPQHRPKPLADKQIRVDRLLKEGDIISAAGATFQVLETPGHSDCSLSFHEPERKILIVSDVTGFYMPQHGWWPDYFTDYAAYLRSMERLAGTGAEILCLSHNAVITGADDVAVYFRDALAATRQYHERIVAEAKAGKPARQIAEELGSEIHQKTPLLPVDFFQKNCALLVKQSLRYEGINP